MMTSGKARRLLASAAIICSMAGPALAETGLDTQLDKLFGSKETTTYSRLTTIQIPDGALRFFDISVVDPVLPLYYVTNIVDASLDVFDTRSNTYVAKIGGFVGVVFDPASGPKIDLSGPTGVQVVREGEVWVSDGNSSVKVVDIFAEKIVQTIDTRRPGQSVTDAKHADLLAYDPKDKVVIVGNNAATPPFVTFISSNPESRHVLGQLVYPDASGVEGIVYDPAAGLFYVNLPQVGADAATGAISVVNPRTMKEVRRLPVTGCNGAGLALAPRGRLLVGCANPDYSLIISVRDGSVLAKITQIGGSDQVAYNPGDGNFYLAAYNNSVAKGGPSLGIVNAATGAFIAKLPTNPQNHAVGVDPRTNHIFVPTAAIAGDAGCSKGCIVVYSGHENESRFERDLEALIADFAKK